MINIYDTKYKEQDIMSFVHPKTTQHKTTQHKTIQPNTIQHNKNIVISLTNLYMLFHLKFKISVHDSKFILYTLYDIIKQYGIHVYETGLAINKTYIIQEEYSEYFKLSQTEIKKALLIGKYIIEETKMDKRLGFVLALNILYGHLIFETIELNTICFYKLYDNKYILNKEPITLKKYNQLYFILGLNKDITNILYERSKQ